MRIIEQMLDQYDLITIEDKKNAIKEIMQEIVLAALAKTDFFKNTAFYGGTALRIYYELDRFSEDLDFTLILADNRFTLEPYIKSIKKVVASLGINVEIVEKNKKNSSNVKSAFLKGNTKVQFLVFYPDIDHDKFIHGGEKIRVKIEIDINPPPFATTETSYRLLPFPFEVKVYDKPSLFAGKLHAVIARNWKSRVKGRDFYDYVFYLSTNTSVNLKHLESRLKQTNSMDENTILTRELLIDILNERFDKIDFDKAKRDVQPFIKNMGNLDIWSSSFFKSITKNIQVI